MSRGIGGRIADRNWFISDVQLDCRDERPGSVFCGWFEYQWNPPGDQHFLARSGGQKLCKVNRCWSPWDRNDPIRYPLVAPTSWNRRGCIPGNRTGYCRWTDLQYEFSSESGWVFWPICPIYSGLHPWMGWGDLWSACWRYPAIGAAVCQRKICRDLLGDGYQSKCAWHWQRPCTGQSGIVMWTSGQTR